MQRLIVGLMLLFIASGASAQNVYDREAKNNLSENDIRSFLYHWFAGFDHQENVSYFIDYLPAGEVDMEFPDFPVQSRDDFRRWYKGVEENISFNSHGISDLKVQALPDGQWKVSLVVDWKARTYDGQNIQAKISQEMSLTAFDRKIMIVRHRAKAI